jgi:multidrug resistance efflux pump
VLDIYDEPGSQVGPTSRQPILAFADVSRRRVRAFVEELDALRIKEGQKAVVTIDGLPGKEFAGKVSAAVLLRMDQAAPRSDAPGEYQDIYHRPVLIDLDGGTELPLNLRVKVTIYIP